MDHLIDKFDPYIESSFENFSKEWETGKYKSFQECPYYRELKTLIDSVNILNKYIGYKELNISGMLEEHQDK